MTHPAPPIAIIPAGPAAVATVVWRSRGRRYVTAVVKAKFAIVPEGRMTPLAPDPIAHDEVPDPSGRGLRAAGDLAPYLRQADVLLTGHVEVPHGFSGKDLVVGLAVVRGKAVLINKRLSLDAAARVGPARAHVHLDGMGPLSREWPRRSGLLRGIDPRRVHGTQLDVPEGLDWTYFQAAAADQRMEPLRGDEWLVLGGIVARRPRLRTQLPEARAVARLYRHGDAQPRAGAPIKMVADTLYIDADRHGCDVVWRGYAPADEEDLSSLRIVAGVELPGHSVTWADPFASAIPSVRGTPVPATPGRAVESVEMLGTLPLSPEDAARAMAAAAMPFEQRGAAAAAASNAPQIVDMAPHADASTLSMTAALTSREAERAHAAPATPFEARPAAREAARAPASPPAPRPAVAAAPPQAMTENPLEGTMALPADLVARLSAAPATPFESKGQSGASPVIHEERVGAIGTVQETAFRAAPAPVAVMAPSPVAVPAPVMAPSPVAVPAPVAVMAPSPIAVPAPVDVVAPSAAPPTNIPEDVRTWPPGLGAEFLAAMADAGGLT